MSFLSAGQDVIKGNISFKGHAQFGATPSSLFAALPILWVNAGLSTGTGFCSPPGGIYDVTVVMHSNSSTVTGVSYAPTFAGLKQAKTDQNAANQWWKLVIDAGLVLTDTNYDPNGALISWPTGTTSTKCLVVQSSNHITDATEPCGHLYPTTKDANCTTSAAKFWKLQIQGQGTGGGNVGMDFPLGSNYILVEDMEIYPRAGTGQSQKGSNEVLQVTMEGDHVGVAGSWIHGWNPGDAGQPTGPLTAWNSGTTYDQYALAQFGGLSYISKKASNLNKQPNTNPTWWDTDPIDATTGVCLAWNRSGTVNTSGTTVNWVSGDYFGMDFSDGTNSSGYPAVTSGGANKLVINGVAYTITSHVPTSSDTALTVSPSAGTQTGVAYTLQNPRTGYSNGCGDDSRGIQINCTQCFFEYSQVNKIHWWGSESHGISSGFSPGPIKVAYVWLEAPASGYFSGGGTVDTRGGPVNDVEIGNLYDETDYEWTFLSGGALHSPGPPFGCGPMVGSTSPSHSTCPFSWGKKNVIEFKFCQRCVIYGSIFGGSWPDGQSGSIITMTPRLGSSASSGVYDPVSGLPATILQNIRWQDIWCRNAPQCFGTSTRSLSDPSNGGGMSGAVHNIDISNMLVTNTADSSQWGTQDDLGNWSTNGQTYSVTMSRASDIAHAVAVPQTLASYKYSDTHGGTAFKNFGVIDNGVTISSVASVSNVVTIQFNGDRKDPVVGGSITIANVPGWNGTFTITGSSQSGSTTQCTLNAYNQSVATNTASQPQPCIRIPPDSTAGTFADTITYTDHINNPGTATLCSSSSGTNPNSCNSTIGGVVVQAILDTYAMNITDIDVGNGVYVHDCTGDSSFEVGATSFVPAIAPTNPAGLDVYYSNPGSPTSGVHCWMDNSAGWPANVSIQHMTVLSDSATAINSNGQAGQHYNNQFMHNIFAETGSNANLTCKGINEGTQTGQAVKCWDANTLQFFDNVLQGRTSSLWPVVPSTASPANVANPPLTTVTCSGATATSACLGYTGYMNGTSFPTANCTYDGSNPRNCPLMAAPYSNNFDLSKIVPVATSSYKNQGVDVNALINAFGATRYVCPAGAAVTCTPFPD